MSKGQGIESEVIEIFHKKPSFIFSLLTFGTQNDLMELTDTKEEVLINNFTHFIQSLQSFISSTHY